MLDPRTFQNTLDKMVEEAEQRMFTKNEGMHRKKLIKRIMRIMNWDRPKAVKWFSIKNPNFGNISPDVLIKMGRGHKVEMFIKCAGEDNGK